MQIQDILSAKGSAVITIVETETIQAASKILREKKFGSLMVRNRHGKLCGIITERDIIRGVADKGAAALAYRVEDLMTREVKTCRPEDLVKDVMEMMSLRKIRHVPVLDAKGELAGIISSTDIVKYRLSERAAEINVLKDLNRAKT
ncbi:MAG: CBS domain-containing protein [Azospirillum sp.]|nr:CBS domain-containing protein [Azospirillum sp.]